MSSHTYFSCDNVQFTAASPILSDATPEGWQPVNVFIIDMGENARGLLVTAKTGSQSDAPLLFCIIDFQLYVDIHSDSKTICLEKNVQGDNLSVAGSLKFNVLEDFWAFLAELVFSQMLAEEEHFQLPYPLPAPTCFMEAPEFPPPSSDA